MGNFFSLTNSISTTWTVPDGTKDIAASVLEILNSYPQEGQDGIDQGGWSIVEGDLVNTGKTHAEFKSGIGKFAILLNGGKPFVDDLTIEIAASEKVEIHSASRKGKSDLGVNQKRLQFLAAKARALGWDAPEPEY